MKKIFYETPQLSIFEIGVERGFATSESADNWYDTDSSWNDQFGFNTETDGTWG